MEKLNHKGECTLETVYTQATTPQTMMMSSMSGGPVFPKWSKESKAACMLRQGLQDGEIDPNAPPKAVYESNPLFKQYKLDSFRSAFNKTKTELGCQHVWHGGGGGFTSKLGQGSNIEDEDDGK